MNDRTKRILRALLAVAVVVGAFFGILPQLADMLEVWRHIREMTADQVGALVGITAWNQVTYWLVAVAALPGLALGQAATVNLASTAVANTVLGGGALGIAVTTKLLRSWGFEPEEIGRYVAVTGIWNNFVKLGMPVVALALLATSGGANGRLVTAAVVGVGVLVASLVVLWLLLRAESHARTIGAGAQRLTNGLLERIGRDGVEEWADRAAEFREDSRRLLDRRWHWLTAATIVGHVSLYLVLLVSLRILGVAADQVSWVEVLAAFSFARLVTAIPVTPGGLGLAELGYVGVLVAFGGAEASVVAGVLVFRTLTYLLPVALGGVAYAVWRHRTGWREDEGSEDPETSATSV